jgi:Predicted 3'-5' exonuclease related to the exonuclease domain of PolB
LKRQLSLPASTMSQWWVKRSSSAVVILASPNTLGHSPKARTRPYFHRFTDDAIDLCEVLSSFAPGAKATLHELCRVMGLLGKPGGIHGGEVEKCYREGRIKEIAE